MSLYLIDPGIMHYTIWRAFEVTNFLTYTKLEIKKKIN